ncbi:MAG TPA: carboxypeptidase-like regulatory domain-containing protein [Acidobacteriaceae bacterium]
MVTDSDGAALSGAQVALRSAAPEASTAATGEDGAYRFTSVPTGPVTVTVTAPGFAPCTAGGLLQPGEAIDIPAISLRVAATADVRVTASPVEVAQAQIQAEEKQRVLGAFPNFFVAYNRDSPPLTSRQKFSLTLHTLVDPVSFALIGAQAGLEQIDSTYAWGTGPAAYGKRYGAAYGTFLNGNLLSSAVLPILLHQDPRYFYKGSGSIASRARYAIAMAVVCRGDNMRWQPAYSAILGSLAAGGISNAYYPAADRSGAALTFEGLAIGTAEGAIENLLQEFLIPHLTPHMPSASAPHSRRAR